MDPRGGHRVTRSERRAAEARQKSSRDRTTPTTSTRRRHAKSDRSDLRRGFVLGTSILAALLATAVLVTSGWAWWTWRGFKQDIRRVDAISGVGQPKKDIDGKDQNILIVGNDDRQTATDAELAQLGTTRDGGSLNTDTMMVLHVPADRGRVEHRRLGQRGQPQRPVLFDHVDHVEGGRVAAQRRRAGLQPPDDPPEPDEDVLAR